MNHYQFLRLTPQEEATNLLQEIQIIYDSSFPQDERRPFEQLLKTIRENPRFSFYAIVEKEDEPVGFLSDWNLDDFIFAEHFAVSGRRRGAGIGQIVLNQWLEKQTLPVVLEVEKPENDISCRRIAFYQRSGFRHWSLEYEQPAYSPDRNPVQLQLMTYGDIDLNNEFEKVKQKIYREVYQKIEDL